MRPFTTILRISTLIPAAFALLLPINSAPAQELGPEAPPEVVKERECFPDQHDPEVESFVEMMTGMYRGSDHTLYVSAVEVPGSAPALYVELVEAGAENKPLRQQLWVPHRKDNRLQVRVCELPLGMRDLVVGMWAAPQLYPRADLGQYASLGDLQVDVGDGRSTGRSRLPMPIAREGAVDYELRFERTADGMRWTDRGTATNGDEIFSLDVMMGPRPGMPGARELDGGILVYDLREGFVGPTPENKDSIVFYFHEWTLDGFLIDTSDQPHRGGYVFTIPNENDAIRSWNLGVIGLRQGGIRRIYDPASATGIFRGELQPFRGGPLPLLTELECVSVKDNTPDN
ncbi:MAG: hypothetical protein H6813_07245 [Phycisphaeraceae bacterium]|nr:hypothetical protein [Phycisphaeraceae bacterium]MCB9848291.1 hypothetical protein [Phycisphaeraceae bacterium]